MGLNLIRSHFGTPIINTSFDYIIINGNTTSLIIVTCLTQAEKSSVAVIKASIFPKLINNNYSLILTDTAYFLDANLEINNLMID
jgi:hypothetical protein